MIHPVSVGVGVILAGGESSHHPDRPSQVILRPDAGEGDIAGVVYIYGVVDPVSNLGFRPVGALMRLQCGAG